MKEKYIFFTLLVIALGLFIGSGLSRSTRGEISAKEEALEKKLKQAQRRKLSLPEKIDMDRVQDLVAFSYYEGMLRRSPFFKVQLKRAKGEAAETIIAAVEERTPLFLYKGKIIAGNRLVVIIEQTRTGETFMVSQTENVDGYKVLDITDREVILSKEGEKDIILQTIEKP